MSILGQPIPINNVSGTRSIPARNLPQSFDTLRFTLDGSTITDPAMHAALTIDFSPDGGVTWASEHPGPTMNPYPVVWEFAGGMTDRQGNLIVDLFYETPPIPDGATRQVRGSLVVTGAPLTTTATITATKSAG